MAGSTRRSLTRGASIRSTRPPRPTIRYENRVSSDLDDGSGDEESLVNKFDPAAEEKRRIDLGFDEDILVRRRPTRAAARRSTYSTTTVSSNASEGDDYETPQTSAMATPAAEALSIASFKGKGKMKSQEILPTRPLNLGNSILRKRKHQPQVDAQILADEILAQKLQGEAYDEDAEDEEPLYKRRQIVHDSDVDDATELSSEESLLSGMIRRGLRKVSTPGQSSRPIKTEGTSTIARMATKNKFPPLVTSNIKPEVDLSSGLSSAIDTESNFNSSAVESNDEDMYSSDDDDNNRGARGRVRLAGNTLPTARAERERRNLEKYHPELPSLWEDLKRVPPIKPVAIEQPTSINRILKQFQLEGVDWMMKQEKTPYKGGLLGDEMGMGKTIQTVTLIMSDYPQKNPTLVVVPPVALMQWSSEINSYTDGKLKVLIHHGTDSKIKKLKIADIKKYNVVMISYAGLESIYRKETKGWTREDGIVKENSRIHAIHWHRVILDEAHSIKARTTGVAKACFALSSDYKWCLSGTPVQNRIGEFFSLLRFLEVAPFASYFCKACPCNQLHWKQDEKKACVSCGHTGFQHVSIFNQELLNPLIASASLTERKEALGKLRLITDRMMLRRMKRNHTASMELPPKHVKIHNEFFSEKERDFSSSIMSNTARTFDTYVSRGVMLNNYANIFGLIMQMRQVANHPDLILKKKAEGGQNVLVCGLCAETAEEPIRSGCKHTFCRQCAKQYVESLEDQQPDCPTCHVPLNIDFEQPDVEQDEEMVKKNSIINRIKMEDWTSSTKIEMLVYDLYKLRKKHATNKSIVFSQFTSMLQLVEWRLKRAGFRTVMLDGSMSPAQRAKSIDFFMNNVDVEVFLVSLKAGGVALNLTEASHVFIVDPWWNPAAEWQSADRCHRIGQTRPCTITRLVVEDSVESRIVLLQEKKARMIASTVNNDDIAMEKLTPEDMQFLFRGS